MGEARHAEVLLKVNAWADSGVAPLVESLNLFGNVETLDSCEGVGDSPAYVYFKCCAGSTAPRIEETCRFVIWLSSALRDQPDPLTDYRLRLEWLDSEEPMAELTVKRDYVLRLAAKIRALSTIRTGEFVTCDTQGFTIGESVSSAGEL